MSRAREGTSPRGWLELTTPPCLKVQLLTSQPSPRVHSPGLVPAGFQQHHDVPSLPILSPRLCSRWPQLLGPGVQGVQGLPHSPTHCSTMRNSDSDKPKAFAGSSSTFSKLPLEQYSITSTFCLLLPCGGGQL